MTKVMEVIAQAAGAAAPTARFESLQRLLDFNVLTLGSVSLTIGRMIAVALLFLVGALVSRIVQAALGRTMRRRNIEDEGLIGATQRLFHYFVLVIVGGYALQVIGFDLSTLFAAGAVAAVAIGFALQNILQNFVSGVIILMERSITPADVLGIDGRMVRIEKMNIRTAVARSQNDEEIIIPNSVLVQSNVTNYTLTDELYRLRATVGVAYSSDIDLAMEALLQAARSVEGRAVRKEPICLLKEFADSSIVFEVSIWLDDPWTHRVFHSEFNIAIWRALKEANITIAFPQLDVHLVESARTTPDSGSERESP